MMMMHGQQPNPPNAPANRKDGILHARIEIGKTVLMGRTFREPSLCAAPI